MLRSQADSHPRYALVEDNAFIRQVWEMMLGTEVLVSFESPEEFFAKAQSDRDFIDGLDGVITDYYFDGYSDLNGDEFAEKLQEFWDKPVLLCSDLPSGTVDGRLFVGQVGKEPPALGELQGLLRQRARRSAVC